MPSPSSNSRRSRTLFFLALSTLLVWLTVLPLLFLMIPDSLWTPWIVSLTAGCMGFSLMVTLAAGLLWRTDVVEDRNLYHKPADVTAGTLDPI